MSTLATEARNAIDKKRNETFAEWEKSYNLIKTEVDSLISSFDDVKKIANPQFQDLTLKFYCIHLCNFFYFHIRKLLVDKNKDDAVAKLMLNGFTNTSNTPSSLVMNNLLSYLVNDDELLNSLCEEYKKIQELRNKYAHGASNQTILSISFDEFKKIYEDVSLLS